MPLIKSKSREAIGKNIETEKAHGKPRAQAIAIALDVARRPDLSLDYLKSLLDNPNPQQHLLKADGCGLILRRIRYKTKKYCLRGRDEIIIKR